MNKKKIIFLVILILFVFGIIIYFLSNEKENNSDSKQTQETNNEKIVEEFTLAYVKNGIQKQEIETKVGDVISSERIMIGSDSYLRQALLKSDSSLEKYEEVQKKYASRVEKYIGDNFTYNIDLTTTTIDKQVLTKVTFRGYYYQWYLNELQNLQSKLIHMAGYDIEKIYSEVGKDVEKIIYMSKIKAMEILDNYLDNYINEYEYATADIITDFNDKTVQQASLMSYYLQLSGLGYKQVSVETDEFQKKMSDRVDAFISNALEDGTLDKSDPLKLK